MTRSRPGPTACFIRFDYPPAFHEFDRGDRSAPGFSRHPHPNADLPIGTLKSIFRQAGWDWRER